ncbi:Nucleoside-diphosphate-sugar epimerase [Olivibacter domesticus]|uniref:Nucleoside-diphosphate-sugar epimerase n=2 Tax=Olivibacter domesticus TaxID=407022 RepID=A0A1H7UWT1_OLID1|nr:Nucleoside-diphosphate-sugar epimerase [Olivibacter domesticus]
MFWRRCMDRNNLLLTGASGFLGAILKEKLNKQGNEIYGLGRDKQEVSADITSSFVFPSDLKIDVVIHAAGKAHSVPKSSKEVREFYDVNFEGTKNICAALEQIKQLPKAFIFISTVSVYGRDFGNLISEKHPLNGVTPYAQSKIMAEKWLTEWCGARGVKLSILRLPLVAGPNPPGNLGAMITGIRSGKYLSIGKADANKSIVWAEDITEIIPKLIELGGVYNLTDGYHPCFSELETRISTSIGKRKPKKISMWLARCLGFLGDLLGERFPLNSIKLKKITSPLTFDDSKAVKELGWTPSRVLDKIAEII